MTKSFISIIILIIAFSSTHAVADSGANEFSPAGSDFFYAADNTNIVLSDKILSPKVQKIDPCDKRSSIKLDVKKNEENRARTQIAPVEFFNLIAEHRLTHANVHK